jgi:tetratricopeptide (TPR) repeat protein
MFRHPIWRFAWVVLVLCLTSVLSLLIYRNLNVRFIADARFQLDRDALLVFRQNIPESPRLNLRIAESYLSDAAVDEGALNEARQYARLAANRSLWDYRAYLVLGSILELSGELGSAEQALRRSITLSPRYTRANWALGNLLLREGRVEESIPFLRAAVVVSSDLYPPAFDLLWQGTGGRLDLLQALTNRDPAAELLLVGYLFEKSLPDQALEVFRQVDQAARLEQPQTARIITQLVDSRQVELARRLWIDLFKNRSATGGQIWNGDFELETSLDPAGEVQRPALLGIFDWNFAPSSYARIGIDGVSNGAGRRSLRIQFVGRDTTTLRQEIRQLVWLRPGVTYRLEFAYQTRDLQSPLGPRVAVLHDSQPVSVTEPIPNGTTGEWRRSMMEFQAPAGERPLHVAIIRVPQFSYDEPTRGVVWFDDIVIREVSPGSGLPSYDQSKLPSK